MMRNYAIYLSACDIFSSDDKAYKSILWFAFRQINEHDETCGSTVVKTIQKEKKSRQFFRLIGG